ncbi:MAG: hypothetical protein ABSH10_09860 [Phycisphaerae bacterium]|jgi:hypothetical protein
MIQIARLVLIAAAVVAVLVFMVLMRRPMKEMLGANSKLLLARRFYMRAMVLILVFAALAAVVNPSELSAGKDGTLAFMDYVWWGVKGLEPALWGIALISLGYVAIVTILYAVLGRTRDE